MSRAERPVNDTSAVTSLPYHGWWGHRVRNVIRLTRYSEVTTSQRHSGAIQDTTWTALERTDPEFPGRARQPMITITMAKRIRTTTPIRTQ